MQVSEGSPHPLGAILVKNGCNFAVHCPDAQNVILCLFEVGTEKLIESIELPAKTGKIRHGYVEGIREGQLYAYRTEGDNVSKHGLCFDAQKLLIDPYAKQLNRPVIWDAKQYQGDSQEMVPKAIVIDTQRYNSVRVADQDPIPLSETILYEAHIKGLSQLHPKVPESQRGTFLGACHPAIIDHIKSLGVTAVQFMPVMAFMAEPFITEKGLTNYWGYNPINYFCPDPRYAIDDPIAEFQQMVHAYHEAGLEVIIDVVYNHTAEAAKDGPMLSFKGFDNPAFYLFELSEYGVIDYNKYVSNSGCGNSVNTAYPYVQKMVMDSLRYWVTTMGVDGFRFDLAASLGRDPHEFSALSGFFRTIRQDPILSQTKLIAEPWDIGYGGYRLGQFPSNWQECNDKYRDNVRGFWRGDNGLTGDFATRFLGSRDVFPKGARSIHSSVNNITYHDGFTLHDLVTYSERHNEANLENNRDGHGHNISANYGSEGETDNGNINILREKQKRNLFVTLIFSQGIPHVLGGDELSRTQVGNNNAYCQDNEISWVDWQLDTTKKDFLAFCKYVIQMRKSSQILSNMSLKDDNYSSSYNVDEIRWYRPDGAIKVAQDWQDTNNKAFALEVNGCNKKLDEHWFLIFNAFDKDVRFHLPKLKSGIWELQLDTRYKKVEQLPRVRLADVFLQAYRTVSVFKKSVK